MTIVYGHWRQIALDDDRCSKRQITVTAVVVQYHLHQLSSKMTSKIDLMAHLKIWINLAEFDSSSQLVPS